MVSRDTLLLESKMAQARRKVYVVGVGMTKVRAQCASPVVARACDCMSVIRLTINPLRMFSLRNPVVARTSTTRTWPRRQVGAARASGGVRQPRPAPPDPLCRHSRTAGRGHPLLGGAAGGGGLRVWREHVRAAGAVPAGADRDTHLQCTRERAGRGWNSVHKRERAGRGRGWNSVHKREREGQKWGCTVYIYEGEGWGRGWGQNNVHMKEEVGQPHPSSGDLSTYLGETWINGLLIAYIIIRERL